MITGTARRNTEVSLMVISLVIAIGGYWLASLSRSPTVPAGIALYGVVYAAIYATAHLAVRKLAPKADSLLLPIALMLNAVGFVVIYRLEIPTENVGLAAAQTQWLVVAIAAFIGVLWWVKDVRALARYRYTFAFAGVVLLLLPTLPFIGREINGARLWIRLGPLSFQPSELGKIALVLFFAGYLSERRELLAVTTRKIGPLGVPALRHFGPVAAAWAVSLLVMINQKDLGSSLLFFAIFVAMLWMATGRPIYLISGVAMFALGAFIASQMFSHVQARMLVWRDPFAYINDRGYQVVQSLFAFATGGAWGTGLGLGRPDLIRFSVHTDFIFSSVGEELGLVGAAAVLTAYALMAARGFGLATRCRDDFSRLLAAGLIFTISFQTILIVGGVTNLIPLTGVTMPFMSYGGSSLLSNFIAIALLLRISDEVSRAGGQAPPTEMNLAAGGGR
ncbi:MAG TPA: FtsW/RodA/SpoVE family cell cycle protein [Actinomycetota bacterium]|nr:FtsW/RodA/SpoVE family cell cycle protein [Actinomycetota bacterium]